MNKYVDQAASKAREPEPEQLGWESVCKWCYRLSIMTVGWWVFFTALVWMYDQWMAVSR